LTERPRLLKYFGNYLRFWIIDLRLPKAEMLRGENSTANNGESEKYWPGHGIFDGGRIFS
jgi:hypothetical protein